MNFITLPSGVRVNTSHIIGYRDSDSKKVRIVHNILGQDGKLLEFEEDMTAEELDSLLRGPEQTPIVSPIVNLDNLKEGEPCSFTYEGKVKHGVLERFEHCSSSGPYIEIVSSGQGFTKYLKTGEFC